MRRVCFVVLAVVGIAVVPSTWASAEKGGSERSYEVRQNGGDKTGGQSGTGQPDAGDNMHPSGNDKSVEPGGSHPQGFSQSDPDGMSNGGADKPGGSGGIDQGDQDGNNGCGNDDDFEDDNNGLCLGQKKEEAAASAPAGIDAFGNIEQNLVLPRSALAFAVEGDQAPAAAAVASQEEPYVATRVLGAVAEAGTGTLSAINGVLPKTGAGIMTLVALAAALIASGLAARRFAR